MSDPSHLVPATVTAEARPNGRVGFAFAPRFFVLLAAGLVWLVPAYFERRFAYVMLAWDAILLFFWAADMARLPKPGKLSISRLWTASLSIDKESSVQIVLRTQQRSAIRAYVIDSAPAAMLDEAREIPLCFSGEEWTARYSVKPRQRGDLGFGAAYLRYQSRLGLAERWAKAELLQKVRVYPNAAHTLQYSLYLLNRWKNEAEQRLMRFRGQAREFESLREYRQGDDYRAISWTATARRAKLVVRQFQTERSQPIWLVLDCGRLMRTEVGRITKLDYAVNAAVNLAHVAMFGGDKVGVLTYGRRPRQQLVPSRGHFHLHQIIDILAIARPEVAEADHLRAAATLLAAQRQRALVIWITDLADTAVTPEVITGASTILPHHLTIFAAVGHPELMNKARQRPTNRQQLYEVTAAKEVVHRRELLMSRLRQQGAYTIEVGPEGLSESIVRKYVEVKQRSLI